MWCALHRKHLYGMVSSICFAIRILKTMMCNTIHLTWLCHFPRFIQLFYLEALKFIRSEAIIVYDFHLFDQSTLSTFTSACVQKSLELDYTKNNCSYYGGVNIIKLPYLLLSGCPLCETTKTYSILSAFRRRSTDQSTETLV